MSGHPDPLDIRFGPITTHPDAVEPRAWHDECGEWTQWVSPATGSVSRLPTAVCRVCGVRKPEEGDAA